MKKSAILIALSVLAFTAQAQCFGSANLQTCTDNSGNSHTINRMGNTTMVDGYNPQTGSRWNQTSQTMGNTTFHDGTAANGQRWHGTTINSPGMQHHFGTDSNGRSSNKICTTAGCF